MLIANNNTEEELRAAVANGGKIALAGNIELTNGTNELTNGTAENPKSNPIRLGMSGSRYFDAQGNEIV